MRLKSGFLTLTSLGLGAPQLFLIDSGLLFIKWKAKTQWDTPILEFSDTIITYMKSILIVSPRDGDLKV